MYVYLEQSHPKQVLRCAPLLLSFLQCSYMYNHTISGILYVTKSEETWHTLKTRAYGAMRVLVVAQIEKRQSPLLVIRHYTK